MDKLIVQEAFWSLEDRGELINFPAEVLFLEIQNILKENREITLTYYPDKFWGCLSAPVYLDRTEWLGPCDSIEEAEDALVAIYEKDREEGYDEDM